MKFNVTINVVIVAAIFAIDTIATPVPGQPKIPFCQDLIGRDAVAEPGLPLCLGKPEFVEAQANEVMKFAQTCINRHEVYGFDQHVPKHANDTNLEFPGYTVYEPDSDEGLPWSHLIPQSQPNIARTARDPAAPHQKTALMKTVTGSKATFTLNSFYIALADAPEFVEVLGYKPGSDSSVLVAPFTIEDLTLRHMHKVSFANITGWTGLNQVVIKAQQFGKPASHVIDNVDVTWEC